MGLFAKIKEGLKKTRDTVVGQIDSMLKSFTKIDESLFEQFQIKRFEDYTEEWAHFVYDHRTDPYGRTLHDYDIVYGPIANDRVGAQITRYKQGYISFEEFLKRIQYIKGITFQYAFCTQRAIDKLIKQTSR